MGGDKFCIYVTVYYFADVRTGGSVCILCCDYSGRRYIGDIISDSY